MDVAFGAEPAVEGGRDEAYLFETLAPGVSLLAVADGFGEFRPGGGALPALGFVRDYLKRTVRAGAFATSMLNTTQLQQTIVAALGHANAVIFSRSGSNDDYIAGGIAVVAALLVGRHVFVAHVGDARLYLARNGRLDLATFDDAIAFTEVQSVVPPLPSAAPEARSVLWRSLGTQARLEAGVSQIELFPGDRMLLCTSAVHRRLGLEELGAILLPADRAAQALGGLWPAPNGRGRGGAAIVAFDPAEPIAKRTQALSPERRLSPTLLAVLTLGLSLGVLIMLKAAHVAP